MILTQKHNVIDDISLRFAVVVVETRLAIILIKMKCLYRQDRCNFI